MQGIDSWVKLIRLVNIPEANFVVITAGKKPSLLDRVPIKTVAFTRVAEKAQVGLDLVSRRAASMLKIIENVHFSANCLCGDDLVRLRHVAGSVDFARVVDLEFDLDALVFGHSCGAKNRSRPTSDLFLPLNVLKIWHSGHIQL